MAKTRPYSVTFKGARRMIVATSQATAKRHIIADEMRKLDLGITIEAAGSMAVAEFVTAGGKIETAGVFVDPDPAGDGVDRARHLFADTTGQHCVLEPGVEIIAGDVLVPLGLGGTYRKAADGDDMKDSLVVGEGFTIDSGAGTISWPIEPGQ